MLNIILPMEDYIISFNNSSDANADFYELHDEYEEEIKSIMESPILFDL